MLLSTKGYDLSTWCISVLNTIEKEMKASKGEGINENNEHFSKKARAFKSSVPEWYITLPIVTSISKINYLLQVVNTGIISIHAQFFRKQNTEMFSTNLNSKRRR